MGKADGNGRRLDGGWRLRPVADRFAIGSSAACLIHCLLLPLAIAFAPGLASVIGANENLHLLIFMLAVPASALAMLAGYRRHALIVPGMAALAGLGLIGAGALGGFRLAIETSVTIAGSILLAAAHLWNLRANKAPSNRPGTGLQL